MSELISGKEALIALANAEEVEFQREGSEKWQNAKALNLFSFSSSLFEFRLRPHTISINGIEVPAPFKPKEGEDYFFIVNGNNGYVSSKIVKCEDITFGAWRTEEEIKQVVAALRQVFGGAK